MWFGHFRTMNISLNVTFYGRKMAFILLTHRRTIYLLDCHQTLVVNTCESLSYAANRLSRLLTSSRTSFTLLVFNFLKQLHNFECQRSTLHQLLLQDLCPQVFPTPSLEALRLI